MAFYIVVIIISFLASIIAMSVKENRRPPLLFFPFFLFLTILVELYAARLSAHNRNNIFVYNIFSLLEFLFYMFFFTWLFHNPVIKKVVFFTIACYAVVTSINIFYIQGLNTFHTYTYILGSVLIVVLSIVYFYLLLRLPEADRLTRDPYFWIVTGLMFFHACSFSYMGLQNFIARTMQHYNGVLYFVQDILNVLLYTLFSIGFLCQINLRKLLGLS